MKMERKLNKQNKQKFKIFNHFSKFIALFLVTAMIIAPVTGLVVVGIGNDNSVELSNELLDLGGSPDFLYTHYADFDEDFARGWELYSDEPISVNFSYLAEVEYCDEESYDNICTYNEQFSLDENLINPAAAAVWIFWEANGGSPNPQSRSLLPGSRVGTLPTVTRTGHTFVGWFTQQTGGVRVTESTVLPNASASITYFARWSRNATVNFNANGGSVNTSHRSVPTQTAVGQLPTPTWQGFVFVGWYTQQTGGTRINANTIITNDVTFFARWEATVTFNGNGGSVSPSTRQVLYRSQLGSYPIPTRNGHTFQGWFTQQSGGDRVTSARVINRSVTFWARWAQNFTVTFNANGGSVNTNSRIVLAGNAVGNLPTPTRQGFVFVGWYTQQTGGVRIANTTIVNGNITYWARWQATVTFNANGGSVSPTTRAVNVGTAVGQLPIPTRTNHIFLGWFPNQTGGTQVHASTIINNNITYWALWSSTVTFNPNGGTATTGRSVISGSAVGILPTTTRTGHTFAGWWTSPTGGQQISANTTVNGHTTFWARWNVSTVTVYWNNPFGDSVEPWRNMIPDLPLSQRSSQLPTPVMRDGYEFDRWLRFNLLDEIQMVSDFDYQQGYEPFEVYNIMPLSDAEVSVETSVPSVNTTLHATPILIGPDEQLAPSSGGMVKFTIPHRFVHVASNPTSNSVGVSYLSLDRNTGVVTVIVDENPHNHARTLVVSVWFNNRDFRQVRIRQSEAGEIMITVRCGTGYLRENIFTKSLGQTLGHAFPEMYEMDGHITTMAPARGFIGWFAHSVDSGIQVSGTSVLSSDTVIYARWTNPNYHLYHWWHYTIIHLDLRPVVGHDWYPYIRRGMQNWTNDHRNHIDVRPLPTSVGNPVEISPYFSEEHPFLVALFTPTSVEGTRVNRFNIRFFEPLAREQSGFIYNAALYIEGIMAHEIGHVVGLRDGEDMHNHGGNRNSIGGYSDASIMNQGADRVGNRTPEAVGVRGPTTTDNRNVNWIHAVRRER